MSIDTLERRKAIIAKALNNEAGRAMIDLFVKDHVNVDLMCSTDRETVSAVAVHDFVIYMMEMGELNV